MTDIICVVGLPGSGKTHYANAKKEVNDLLIDDIRNLDELPENGKYDTVYITDPYFCISSTREKAETYLLSRYNSVKWVFFENNKTKCLNNVKYRNDGRLVSGLISYLSPRYEIPNTATVMTIWQN